MYSLQAHNTNFRPETKFERLVFVNSIMHHLALLRNTFTNGSLRAKLTDAMIRLGNRLERHVKKDLHTKTSW